MKIENITISNVNLDNNSAKLTFNISECTKNTDVYLKINEDEYISIYTNKTNGTLSYDLNNLRRGINNLFLKLKTSTEEYITDIIVVKIKKDGSIDDFKCIYTDSNGKYVLEFLLLGDTYLKYSIDINIDDKGYKQIFDAQMIGNKTYEGTGLSLGSHKCKLKINDGYDIYETSEYTFNVVNNKPTLSDIAVIDIKNVGTCSICYGVSDVENSILSHSLTIDNNKKSISPVKTNDFYSYDITGLSIGKHTLMISVSDGKDIVDSNVVTIELFQSSTNNKRLLEIAKIKYDFAYQQLKRVIESTISDGIFNYNIENEVIIKSQNYYKEMYSEFNRISMVSIDIIGNKKIETAKTDLNNEINDVYNAVDTLENTMETTFKDGILSDSEKDLLKNNLNLIAKEKVDIDKDYENLYNNEDLVGDAKNNLKNTYDVFINKHNTLVTIIDNIVNKAGIIDNTDKSNLDEAFANWRTALGDYRNASMNAIDSIARKKIDDNADIINKYWSETIYGEDGITSRVGSLETKVSGTGGVEERLRNAEQIITKEGITDLVKDEFYSKEVVDTKIEEKVNDAIGDNVEDVIGETLEGVVEEKVGSVMAEHTTALNNITSRVSTTEKNIESINGEIINVTERVSATEQKITDDAITNVVSEKFYTKTEADEQITEKISEVNQTVSEWSATIKENGEEISKLKLTSEEFGVEIKNKVDDSNIISKINASTEGVTISSSKINISGFVTFSDLSTGGKTTINGSNITTGTLSGNLIQGGTIKGVTLQTYVDSTSKGVIINKESMYLNGTKFLYHTSDNFRIASDQTLTLSSPKDIYLLAGLSTNESQTGTNNVVIPSATLRTQKLLVINDTTIQGACAVSKAFSCASVSCIGSIAATNGFSSSNGGLVVTGSITTNSGNINATAGQVKSKTLSVTSSSTLSGTVTCGGSLNATSGTITAKALKSTGAINCASFASTGDASFGNNVWIKYLYVNGTWVSSDKRKKMDIRYVDKDEQTIAESGLIAPNVNINKNDMHEFIEALPIASYRYIEDVENKKDVTHYGLVVQDVLYTKVGSELVKVLDDEKQIGDENDYMGYSQEKLLTFMCGALQKEIELRKELEKRIEELENKSNK